jgi:hypothetical protein
MNVVRTGLANASQVQIVDGVQPGDLVILPGSVDLVDGLAIAPTAPPTIAVQLGSN